MQLGAARIGPGVFDLLTSGPGPLDHMAMGAGYVAPPRNSNMHEQVWIKVNAPVDAGIAEIIEALGAFPMLRTIESCQGNGEDLPAWVCFEYGAMWEHPWQDLAEFGLGYLGPALAREVGDRVDLTIRVTEAGLTRGELSIRPGAEGLVAAALIRLGDEFRRMIARKCVCSCGT